MNKFLTSILLTAAAFTTVNAAESVPYSHSFEGENALTGYTLSQFPADGTAFKMASPGQTPYAYRDLVYVRSMYRVCDAWLITPQFSLEAGKTYNVTFTCAESAGNRELVGMFAGTSTSTSDLKEHSILVKDQYSFENNGIVTAYFWGNGFTSADQAKPLKGEFTPDTSGDYNFALWVCSDKDDGYYFGVYSIEITEMASGSVPGNVTNMTATPNAQGYLKAEVSCTTPTTNLDGSPATLTKLEFLRDGEVINTVNNPAVGREYKYTDTGMTNGNHTYGAVCYNADGRGNVVDAAQIYVGTYQPEVVTDLEAHEVANGQIRLTWTAPTSTINYYALNPDMLTYKVYAYDLDGTETAEFGPFSTTEATVTVNTPGNEQEFITLGVVAITTGGVSNVTKTNPVVVGTPDDAPFYESFSGGKFNHASMTESVRYNANWVIRNFTQDNDGGALRFEANGINAEANYYTGRIALPAGSPMFLNFYYSGFSNNNSNILKVEISVNGSAFESLGEFEANTADWKRATIDLADYAGKNIQLRFNGLCLEGFYILLDNISIDRGADNDLTISDFVFPVELERCQPTEVIFLVKNVGQKDAENFSMSLYCNNEVIKTIASTSTLKPGESTEFNFEVTADRNAPDQLTYYAVVYYAADEDNTNNNSARIVVRVFNPDLEAPTNLRGTVEDQDVTLTWDFPEGASFDSESPFHHLYGFTLYRDDKMVNFVPLKETTFVDRNVPVGTHTYYVVASYEWSTSPKSNTEEVTVEDKDGIDSIMAELNGEVSVYTIGGVLLNKAATKADLLNLPAGLYIVGGHKVVIK